MSVDTQVRTALEEAIDRFNETREPEEALDKSSETILIGEKGRLDSLGFVNFAVAVEESVERVFGEEISVMDLIEEMEGSEFSVGALTMRIGEHLANASRG